MTPHILILAAGAASRMRGGDKLLEPVAGVPLLTRIAQAALATGCPVTVTLPPDRPARSYALAELPLTCLTVADAAAGMARSIIAGVQTIPAQAPILLVLADLPMLTAQDFATLLARHRADPTALLRGADPDGTPGHPVLLPPDLRPELLALTGDEGARPLLKRHADRLRLVPLPAGHATTDLDTPEDWAEWRARHDHPPAP